MFRKMALVSAIFASSCQSPVKPPPPPLASPSTDLDVLPPLQGQGVPVPDWTRIASAQMVFLAVTEGLQEEPLDAEILSALVPVDHQGRAQFDSRFFIWGCPLCHPVFEALRAARSAPKSFAGLPRGTLGQASHSAEFRARLLHSSAVIQRNALEELITVWIKRRIEKLHLTETQLQALQHDFALGQGEALRLIIQARDAGRAYDRGNCPICQGSIGAGMIKLR